MCQKAPGPRCANHLRTQIATTRAQIRANMEAFLCSGTVEAFEPPYPTASGDLVRLEEEYDETRTGQADLAAEINRCENNGDTYEADRLRARMFAAADRRKAKLAALKSLDAGDEPAARYQLRYGAHAGWLARTDLTQHTDASGGPTVFADYAVGISGSEDHDEESGYGDHATNYTVRDLTGEYAAPVLPGPRPGTWLIGTTQQTNPADPRRADLPGGYAANPNQGHLPAQPVLFDAHHNTVARFDPSSGLTLGEPAPVDSPAGLRLLDHHDGFDLYSDADPDDAHIHRVEPRMTVTDTGEGKHVLRGTFAISCAWAQHSRRIA